MITVGWSLPKVLFSFGDIILFVHENKIHFLGKQLRWIILNPFLTQVFFIPTNPFRPLSKSSTQGGCHPECLVFWTQRLGFSHVLFTSRRVCGWCWVGRVCRRSVSWLVCPHCTPPGGLEQTYTPLTAHSHCTHCALCSTFASAGSAWAGAAQKELFQVSGLRTWKWECLSRIKVQRWRTGRVVHVQQGRSQESQDPG